MRNRALLLIGGLLSTALTQAQVESIELISVGPLNAAADSDSAEPRVSADGRFVVFSSSATNLVVDDRNGIGDVFFLDRQTATLELISIASDDVTQGNGQSSKPFVSDDGRYVAFQSQATNLIANDNNGQPDVFIRDRQLGTTSRASLSNLGTEADRLSSFTGLLDFSGDGRFVIFSANFPDMSDPTSNQNDLWRRDLVNDETTLISQSSAGVAASVPPSSAATNIDGTFVTFVSASSNLVADDTNGLDDVFLRDVVATATDRVSLAPDGSQIETGFSGTTRAGGVSDDGRFVAFANSATDLYDPPESVLRDRIVRHDTMTGENLLVSIDHADQISEFPRMSGDGNTVSYNSPDSFFSNSQIYLRQIDTGQTILISQNTSGGMADAASSRADLSANGQVVAFVSSATDLVADDRNNVNDIFVAALRQTAIFADSFESR